MSLQTIIVAHLYHPGSAASNRILAYVKGFLELGLDVHLVLGCKAREEKPILAGVDVIMVGNDSRSSVTREMASAIKRVYQKDTGVILVYGTPSLCWYLPHPRYHIFYECTEIPFFGRQRTLKTFVVETVKMILAKRATGMLVISQALKEYFLGKGIRRIEVINMFVDNSRFEHKQSNAKEKYIAYCGWISEFKDGVDCLIKAFAEMKEIYQDFRLYLIGDFISFNDKIRLENLVESPKLNDSVVFTGKVAPEKMPDLLCSAKILALARPNNEQSKYGFPTKLGEYLATGIPVVVTDVGEIGSFLYDKQNCIVTRPDDPHAFCEALKWVISHPEEAANIARRGKLTVRQEFSYSTQSKKAFEFFERVTQSLKN